MAAVERLFEYDGTDDLFVAVVAPDLLVPGANDIELHLVGPDGTFHPLAG